jgi:hypothetical protein
MARTMWGCPQCGYLGGQGCPVNDKDCPKGLYKPPKTWLDDMEELLKKSWAFARLAQRNDTVYLTLDMGLGNEQAVAEFNKDAVNIDTLLRVTEAFHRGYGAGFERGESRVKKMLRTLLGVAKED